jgi:hypothetical protein
VRAKIHTRADSVVVWKRAGETARPCAGEARLISYVRIFLLSYVQL